MSREEKENHGEVERSSASFLLSKEEFPPLPGRFAVKVNESSQLFWVERRKARNSDNQEEIVIQEDQGEQEKENKIKGERFEESQKPILEVMQEGDLEAESESEVESEESWQSVFEKSESDSEWYKVSSPKF